MAAIRNVEDARFTAMGLSRSARRNEERDEEVVQGDCKRHRSGSQLDRSTNWLPWAWCNLRRNPFGELTGDERAHVAVVDVDVIRRHVRDRRRAVQLIGDCGRGKTTRLLALADQLPRSFYVYLAEDEPCGPIAEGWPLLIDEAQRLPGRLRKSVLETGLPLVLATHRDLGRTLRNAGYDVMTQWIGKQCDPTSVQQIFNRRIESSRLTANPVPQLSLDEASTLVNRFGDNIRAMEAYLYEVIQSQTFRHGEVRFID